MDWHHPDYLPRRGWESRTTDGADFDRSISHMKKQVISDKILVRKN